MNGLRFKVGEMAIVAVATNPINQDRLVEIKVVGPFKAGDQVIIDGYTRIVADDVDYILDRNKHGGGALDWQLRKIEAPAEPTSITRHEEREGES